MACGWGVGYDFCRIFVVRFLEDVVKLCCILYDVQQSKLTLELHEPHGWLFRPERQYINTNMVGSEN